MHELGAQACVHLNGSKRFFHRAALTVCPVFKLPFNYRFSNWPIYSLYAQRLAKCTHAATLSDKTASATQPPSQSNKKKSHRLRMIRPKTRISFHVFPAHFFLAEEIKSNDKNRNKWSMSQPLFSCLHWSWWLLLWPASEVLNSSSEGLIACVKALRTGGQCLLWAQVMQI